MNDFKRNKGVQGLLSLALAATLWGAFIAPAEARHNRHHDDGSRQEQSDDGDRGNWHQDHRDDRGEWSQPQTSRKDAARRAQSRYGGRILSVDPEEGGPGYRIKSLSDDGTVRTLHED
jgi:uncharacterized membrane protein YkoI